MRVYLIIYLEDDLGQGGVHDDPMALLLCPAAEPVYFCISEGKSEDRILLLLNLNSSHLS